GICGQPSSALFTAVISSLISTVPLPSQSPQQGGAVTTAVGVAVGDAVAVAVAGAGGAATSVASTNNWVSLPPFFSSVAKQRTWSGGARKWNTQKPPKMADCVNANCRPCPAGMVSVWLSTELPRPSCRSLMTCTSALLRLSTWQPKLLPSLLRIGTV